MNRRLQTPPTVAPLGVIDTLTAGLSVMARHAWLLVLPIALDLFLWLVPPLVIGARLRQMALPPLNMATFLVGAPDPTMAADAQSLYDSFVVQISQTNFWGWAIPGGLFFPSVTVGSDAGATDLFWSLENPLTFFLAFAGLTLFGLFLNVSWLHTVAFAATRNSALLKLSSILRSFRRVVGFGILVLLIVAGALFLTFLVLAVLALVLPGVGTAIWTIVFLLALWWAIWVGVQLYFTAASFVVGRQSVTGAPNQSAYLLRRHPDNPHWRSGYGFIFITVVLSRALAYSFKPFEHTNGIRIVSMS